MIAVADHSKANYQHLHVLKLLESSADDNPAHIDSLAENHLWSPGGALKRTEPEKGKSWQTALVMQASSQAPKYHILQYKYVADILEKREPHRQGHLDAIKDGVSSSEHPKMTATPWTG